MRRILYMILLLAITGHVKTYSQITEQDTAAPLEYLTAENDSVQSLINAYTSLEPQVLADIDWLNNTPVKENPEMRNEKSRFVLMWMSGSPTTSIQMDDRILTFLGADPAILMAYMTGWTKYVLENNYSDDAIQCSVAGITNAVNFYTANRKSFKKNGELEKYKKMIGDGTLTRHVADVLTRP